MQWSIMISMHESELSHIYYRLIKFYDLLQTIFWFIPCISTIAAFFSFAKTSMGSGSFALPWAISQSGVIFGSFGFILIGVVRYYCTYAMAIGVIALL